MCLLNCQTVWQRSMRICFSTTVAPRCLGRCREGWGAPVPHAGKVLLVTNDARRKSLFGVLLRAAQQLTRHHTLLTHCSDTHWLTSSDVLVRTRPLGLPVKPIMFMRLLAAAEPPPYILAVLH